MNEGLLEKIRKMNRVLQTSGGIVETNLEVEDLPFTEMMNILGDILNANTYLIDATGKLLGYYEKHHINNERVKQMLNNKQFPAAYASSMLEITRTSSNIGIESEYTVFPTESRDLFANGLTTIIPIFAAGDRLGTLLLARMEPEFNNDDLILAEHASALTGIEVLNKKNNEIEKATRDEAMINMALNTLSYSELKALKAVFEQLDGLEGRLTASNVADRIGVTRSVIVNALRKIESAGIVESRSLGMKGTFIHINNPNILKALGIDR
ncbi:GTP-sensing pleiotropic transcriptional regulator CodY [Pisciglobus halotolerans]|uniref:Global transcriptional regulator CodY n=1 Tax=Pisciglobus halotolerans TaxID=745365 RepID=A0A1I3BDB1_9LACT|nr:GTP-sensing pleiotropic transcriptional regulator CodY [Pisciglobus halotolerans]SFH59701.1 transcriptional pleiotropic repressor [Pisciglobus halotolerans]